MAESEKDLQKMLDVVSELSKLERFKLNRDKSNVMIFGGSRQSLEYYSPE